MTHKVNPKSFRIRGIEDFNIRGFYGNKMSKFLEEDFLVKDFLRTKFSEASIKNIEIEHSNNKMNIIIETARPGLIIGRGGEGIEDIKKQIEKKLNRLQKLRKQTAKPTDVAAPKNIKIDVKEVKNPWVSAALVGEMAAKQIEKRMPFRQVLKKSIERVMQNKEVKGIKMEFSGRLNGIEIARKEWLKQGRMPLQSIRADIDYCQTQAFCSYGVIGVQVWIYKGDNFN